MTLFMKYNSYESPLLGLINLDSANDHGDGVRLAAQALLGLLVDGGLAAEAEEPAAEAKLQKAKSRWKKAGRILAAAARFQKGNEEKQEAEKNGEQARGAGDQCEKQGGEEAEAQEEPLYQSSRRRILDPFVAPCCL